MYTRCAVCADANLKKCIRAYCDSQAAVKAWRSVAKLLGLKEDEIARIAGEQKAPTKEMAQEMLRRWKQIRGKDATKDNLIVTLRKLKLNEAAGKKIGQPEVVDLITTSRWCAII